MMETTMTPAKALHHVNEEIKYLDRRIASSVVDGVRHIKEARRSTLFKQRKVFQRLIRSDEIRFEK